MELGGEAGTWEVGAAEGEVWRAEVGAIQEGSLCETLLVNFPEPSGL